MMKLAMSPAAAGLLRALLARAGVDRNRILLSDFRSMDWNSLTLAGERHEIILRIPGPGAAGPVTLLVDGLEEADFTIPGQIVADIALIRPPSDQADGSILVEIEALTVAE
ncbi:hypothetical protein [Sphingomonas sp.]|uniref:hypothetical protein n=1 Tax=Sphingomonas sp. TaxID=28214 RepID=UPI00286B756C|nr:hypothetical protein [Sphingomonas sp.]